MEMIIQGAALVNRFYVVDGWTKEKVAELLVHPEDGNKIETRYDKEFSAGIPKPDGKALYFACYGHYPFNEGKIKEHEYKPFSKSECDQLFSQKNNVI